MIAKEGFPFIITSIIVFFVILLFPKNILLIILLVLVAFFIWFFRDPERNIPPYDDIVVSPADGKIVEITEENFDDKTFKKISIFMNIFDVHVNRAPLEGEVVSVEHKPGKFLAADNPKSSLENEQNIIRLSTKYGEIVLKQVAGLVARRTVAYVKSGDKVLIGDRIGIIKFSSRVDLYLPLDFYITVEINDRVKAGESIIARYEKDD
ncbi:phosphatidylserine decarboxylase [Deferribacter desulfuricans SSM1]|uniref:Phosphatidylserine decarboxylase proenzyme n=1 Tax=Deferribacter desulfuricans (strain DSM 14783 / JCM 11476 / NBRC 101012 / SSM1) TaxID=639282 RepID=D3P8T0_DEFDS|nr:phosphatidylserine decarboxylase family protein [Deferribacter desulfuricans]BAI81120.1 phosphatidylserine decarboxylase [Deferribacter desulfuricans SSM1]